MSTLDISLSCPYCRGRLTTPKIGQSEWQCASCHKAAWGEVLPAALEREPDIATGEWLGSSEEASCYFHAQKRAEVVCDGCGRFLCSLCQMEWASGIYCGDCISEGNTPGANDRKAGDEVFLTDRVLLSLAVLPMFLFWATLVTAPLVLFLAFYWRKRPKGLLQRVRWRTGLAITFAVVQIIGWIVLGVEVFYLAGSL